MASFAGLRGTGNWGTDERPKNFREMILWLNPNGSAPLTALMSRMKKQSTNDPEFAWWEETLAQIRITINYTTGYDSTANTVVIDDGGLSLVAGDILLCEAADNATYTNEIVTVSSVTSDTTIVIKRGQAGTTKADASLANNAALTKIGNAFEEGSTSPDVSLRNPTKLYNYAQIFKTAVEETVTASNTKTRTGDSWMNDKKRKSFDHSISLEQAFMFGKRYEDTGGTKIKRYTGGLRQFISTHVTLFTTTPTEDTLLDALYPVFDYESAGAGNQRLIFAGNGFLNSLNKLARNSSSTQVNFDKVISYYGMNLQRWILPQGEVYVKTHPLMNTHAKFTYSAFVINPAGIIYRPLRDTRFQDNIQANDKDSRKGQWITEAGLEVQHEKTFAYIGNFVV